MQNKNLFTTVGSATTYYNLTIISHNRKAIILFQEQMCYIGAKLFIKEQLIKPQYIYFGKWSFSQYVEPSACFKSQARLLPWSKVTCFLTLSGQLHHAFISSLTFCVFSQFLSFHLLFAHPA